jgi:hypothetical protein
MSSFAVAAPLPHIPCRHLRRAARMSGAISQRTPVNAATPSYAVFMHFFACPQSLPGRARIRHPPLYVARSLEPQEANLRRRSARVAKGSNVMIGAVMAACALVVAMDAASAAAKRSRHDRVIGQPTVQYAPSDLYESLSQGRQSYPNPDREFWVPQREN